MSVYITSRIERLPHSYAPLLTMQNVFYHAALSPLSSPLVPLSLSPLCSLALSRFPQSSQPQGGASGGGGPPGGQQLDDDGEDDLYS